MLFTVTYRNAAGASATEVVEAANRAECFSKCRAKGILPMGIEASRSDGKTRRSDRETRRSNDDARRSNRKTRRSVLVVVLVAAVLAGVGFWLWTTRSKVTMQVVDGKPKKTALAKEVKPAKAAEPKPAPAQEPPKQTLATVTTNEAGIPIDKNGKPLWLYPPPPMHRPCVTTGTHSVQSIQEKVFVHPSDQMVASLLMMQPGDVLVGESEDMFVGFKEQFLKSLETPIVIEDEDTDFVKELKAGVQEMRKELKARLDAGEDIEKTLVETRKELRSLGLYREELEGQLKEMGEDKTMTEQDMRDYVNAANMMLKERGAREIEMPEMLLRRLRLRDVRRRAAAGR